MVSNEEGKVRIPVGGKKNISQSRSKRKEPRTGANEKANQVFTTCNSETTSRKWNLLSQTLARGGAESNSI